MHEYSIATEIYDSAIKVAEENHATAVSAIELEIGELAMINCDQLTFCMESIVKGTLFEDAELKISEIKAEIRCGCGYTGKAADDSMLSYLICPQCNTPAELIRGREIIIREITICT
jgi:hydrogenase nickel incorporation protein HypA/HybF